MSASVTSDRANIRKRGTMLTYIFSMQGWGSLVVRVFLRFFALFTSLPPPCLCLSFLLYAILVLYSPPRVLLRHRRRSRELRTEGLAPSPSSILRFPLPKNPTTPRSITSTKAN